MRTGLPFKGKNEWLQKTNKTNPIRPRPDEGIGPDEKQRVSVSQRGDARVLWPYIIPCLHNPAKGCIINK